MHYNALGRFCETALENIPQHYPYSEVPVFIVMPNHIHAIIGINETDNAPQIRIALSVVIGGLKQKVSMFARRNNIAFAWQSRYHDHIIRNHNDGNKIAEYIEANVERWGADEFYQ